MKQENFILILKKIVARGLIALLEMYREAFSSLLPSCCRFSPSCSVYMEQALLKKGLREGLRLGLGRLLSCHPFHRGGYDPVR